MVNIIHQPWMRNVYVCMPRGCPSLLQDCLPSIPVTLERRESYPNWAGCKTQGGGGTTGHEAQGLVVACKVAF